ncbi:MAG: ABC transporter ATP-binding protein, partial [Candidatus Thorarchaeota archaeon]|nr:ABC transporter ATP-binding protein [Candidatus Thorarchaeota archaeon]
RRGSARGVDGISLRLEKNKTLGLAGESGCGKSTLGRSIIRLVPPPGEIVAGDIFLNVEKEIKYEDCTIPQGEVNITELSEKEMRALRGKEIAYIFQDPMTSLNPMLNIGNHFVETIQAHEPDMEEEEALEIGAKMLESLGILPERISDYPHQFSGGMRQRVMVGLGLVLRPTLLIADEPTTSLDVVVEAQILEEMAELKEQFDLTMILITHNLGVLAQTADSIAIIYCGRIAELTSTETLFESPQHPYTQALLQSVPDVTKPDKKLTWIPGAPPDLINLQPGCAFYPRCTHAMDICRSEQPHLREVNGSLVACHLYGG